MGVGQGFVESLAGWSCPILLGRGFGIGFEARRTTKGIHCG